MQYLAFLPTTSPENENILHCLLLSPPQHSDPVMFGVCANLSVTSSSFILQGAESSLTSCFSEGDAEL